MLNFYILLLVLTACIFHLDCSWGSAVINTSFDHQTFTGIRCREHCRRLLERSLDRIGYSSQKVGKEYSHTRLLLSSTERFANSKYYKDICWKYFDFGDCNRKCERTSSSASKRSRRRREQSVEEKNFVKTTKLLIKSCKASMDNELLANFKCIHKYHTFLEVQCSSYAQEALVLRKIAREDKRKSELTLGELNLQDSLDSRVVAKRSSDRYQETCRFLHYHNMCLSNSIFQYCPTAKDLFNRFTLRDFFLSFVLPMQEEDHLFSDPFLDHCQLYDFAKIAKDIYDSIKKPTTKRSLIEFMLSTASPTPTKPRKIFSSDEDLEETPPNFYYSSAKYEKDFVTYATTRRYNKWDPSFTGSLEDETEQQPSISLLQPSSAAVKTATSSPVLHQTRPIAVTFPDQLPTQPLPANENHFLTVAVDDPHATTNPRHTSDASQGIRQKEEYSSKWSIASTKADAHLETTTIHSLEEQKLVSPSVVIDVYMGSTEADYYSSTEDGMDDYVIDSSTTTQSYSTETTTSSQERRDSSSDLFPIVFPVTGEKQLDSSTMQTTKYHSVAADNSPAGMDEPSNVWATTTQQKPDQESVMPTPLFTDSRIHVKKILPFDENIEEQDINNKRVYKQDVDQEDRLGEIDSQVESEDYYEEEDEEEAGSEEEDLEDYTPPYTIITAHPDNFMSSGKNLVGEDTSTESSSNKDSEGLKTLFPFDTNADHTPHYYANTLFVIFAIYSSFFIVTIASVGCLLVAYVLRSRRDSLKASWIFFDDQERF